MENYQQESAQQDILTDFETTLEQASSGKRFANYIIDLIVYYVVILLIGIFWALINPQTIDQLDSYDSLGSKLLDRLIGLILYGPIMGTFEAIFKGRTLGKLITGTLAVNEDGSTISAKTAFLRGFSRAVPLEVFSALGSPTYPWHDKWTNTYVIDLKKSRRY